MFKTIVFGTDGSVGSDAAFEAMRVMATEAGARVFVVHVVELVDGKDGLRPFAADEDELEAGIRRQVEQLGDGGVVAELVVERISYGGPARIIAEVADKVGADVIVVGTRGRSPISELLTGGVPVRLLDTAHRPVLVVPSRSRDRVRRAEF